MKKSTKPVIFATLLALLGAGYFMTRTAGSKASEEQLSVKITSETLNYQERQSLLNKAFEILNPQNISEVIYDPDYKRTEL